MIRRREQDPTLTRRIYRLHASHASSHPFPLQAGHSPSLESSPRTVSQHHLAGGARPSIPFSREHNDKKSVRLRSFRSLGFDLASGFQGTFARLALAHVRPSARCVGRRVHGQCIAPSEFGICALLALTRSHPDHRTRRLAQSFARSWDRCQAGRTV